MADHTKVVVYLRADDVRLLKALRRGEPALWVRALVKEALAEERHIRDSGASSDIGITDSSDA